MKTLSIGIWSWLLRRNAFFFPVKGQIVTVFSFAGHVSSTLLIFVIDAEEQKSLFCLYLLSMNVEIYNILFTAGKPATANSEANTLNMPTEPKISRYDLINCFL